MSKRQRGKDRCPGCRMRVTLCICADIPRLETRTHVVLILHYRELRLPTNTGRLAHQCLPNSRLLVRGEKDTPLDLGPIDAWPGTPILLSPGDDAQELDARFMAATPPPYTLFVPDGSWRQASKVGAREPSLRDIPRVKLPLAAPSRYHLRREPKSDGLATIEAIARALGAIESPGVQAELERIFDRMVAGTLRSRGTSQAAGIG